MLGMIKTGTRKEITVSILWIIFIGALTFLLNLYWNPRFVGMKPDSSLFAYGGKMITEGKLLYRDFWDHKPPAIFYVDALAIRLMGTSLWTFWWADIFWIALSTSALFLILRKLTGTFSAMLASGIFLVTLMYPTIFTGGNLAEMYGTLPLILIIGVAFLYFQSGRTGWAFALGLLTAVAFLFKQTCIALGIGTALAIFILNFRSRQYQKGLIHLAWMAAGVILPLGVIALIWVHAGAWGDLLDAVFAYNVNYVGSGISLATFSSMFSFLLLKFPLMPVSIATLGGLGIFIARNRSWLFLHRPVSQDALSPDQVPARQLTFLAVFIALPFEVAFIALGGRNYLHYYMTILPVFAAASAYLIESLTRSLFSRQKVRVMELISLVALALLGLVWIVNAFQAERPTMGLRINLAGPFFGPLPQSDIERFILSHTQADDSVLVWQDNKSLNLSTGRRNPSRYLYPEHLFQPKSGPESRFDQFLQDLQNDPPALILVPETPDPRMPFITAPADQFCPGCIPAAAAGLERFKAYVDANYMLTPQEANYEVYVRIR
jgi:hypothetical protein